MIHEYNGLSALEESLVKEIGAVLSKFMKVLKFPFLFKVYIIKSSFIALHHQPSPSTMPKLQEIVSAVLNKDKKGSIKVE